MSQSCSSTSLFKTDVVLKGGTAFNRIYLSKLGVSRFSEDIDLDYLKEDKLNDKIRDIKKRMKDVTEFNVKGPLLLHRTLRFDCYYENELGTRDRIMVEFYLTKNPHIERNQMMVKSPFVETHPTIFSVYSIFWGELCRDMKNNLKNLVKNSVSNILNVV